jgi:uncharacterized protein (TIGR03066 family)
MRVILGVALLAVMGLTAGTGVGAQDDKIDAKKLVGKWTPKETDSAKVKNKYVVSFAKDGKLTWTNQGEKATPLDGTYKLDGNKLMMAVMFGDREEEMTLMILKLTDTDLVGKDEKGKEVALVRVKEKK